MPPALMARLRAELGVGEREAARLREDARATGGPDDGAAGGVLARLYEGLSVVAGDATDEAGGAGGAIRARLGDLARVHDAALGLGFFDEDYGRDLRWVGEVCHSVGVPFASYLGAYAGYLEARLRDAWRRAGDDDEALEGAAAWARLALLDVGLVSSAYHDEGRRALKRQAMQLDTLHRSAVALSASIGLAEVLGEVLRWGMALAGAQAAAIALVTEGIGVSSTTSGLSEQAVAAMAFPHDRATAAVLADPARVVFSGGERAEALPLDQALGRDGVRSGVHLGLLDSSGTRVLAVVCLWHRAQVRLPAERAALLQSYARLAGQMVDNARAHGEAMSLARTDSLTGLANRRRALERLDLELRRARSFAKPFSVLAVDIDHFKRVNDRFGHAGGDAVLRDLGLIALEQLRDVDLAARVGGEEFLVLLPKCDAEGGRQAAERFRKAVDEAAFRLPSGGTTHVTVSIGLATFPDCAADGPSLTARADAALYAAKWAGRNCTRGYPEVLLAEIDADHRQVAALLAADPSDARPLVAAIDCRVPGLLEHSRKVVHTAVALACELGLTEQAVAEIERAGWLHDIGLLLAPESAFCGADVDDGSWVALTDHPSAGALLIESVAALGAEREMIAQHHEHFDGSGYPAEISGQAIVLGARILAVADNYSVLTTKTAFREALSASDAMQLMMAEPGRFDPAVMAVLKVQVTRRGSEASARNSTWLDALDDPRHVHHRSHRPPEG